MPSRPPVIVVASSDFAAAVGNESSEDPSLAELLRGTGYCIGTPIFATLNTRQRGGIATLCGFDTYLIINPGRQIKLRRKTLAGQINYCYYDTPIACLIRTSSFGIAYQGVCTYDPATCAETIGTQVSVIFGDAACNVGAPVTWSANACTTTGPDCNLQISDTVTQRTISGTGGCCAVNASESRTAIGVYLETLTDQDTDADAIARDLAANPWSAWAPCAASGCALAQWEDRGHLGFSFQYQECGFRIIAAGLQPNRAVCALADVYRAPYGTGVYVLYATAQLTGNTDGAGNLVLESTVPNDIGFDTYVTNPRYFPPIG